MGNPVVFFFFFKFINILFDSSCFYLQREKEEEVKAVEETNKKKELEERARQEYDKVGAEGVGRVGGGGGGGGIHKARKWKERSTERGVEEEGKHVHTFTRTCVPAFLEWFTVSTLLLL